MTLDPEIQGALIGVAAILTGWLVSKFGAYIKLSIEKNVTDKIDLLDKGTTDMVKCDSHEKLAERVAQSVILGEQHEKRLEELKTLVLGRFDELRDLFNRHIDHTEKIHFEQFDRIRTLETNVRS
jgi:hypothetical protein